MFRGKVPCHHKFNSDPIIQTIIIIFISEYGVIYSGIKSMATLNPKLTNFSIFDTSTSYTFCHPVSPVRP